MKAILYVPGQPEQEVNDAKLVVPVPRHIVPHTCTTAAAAALGVSTMMLQTEDRGLNHLAFVVVNSTDVNEEATVAIQGLTHNHPGVWDASPVLGPCLLILRD